MFKIRFGWLRLLGIYKVFNKLVMVTYAIDSMKSKTEVGKPMHPWNIILGIRYYKEKYENANIYSYKVYLLLFSILIKLSISDNLNS